MREPMIQIGPHQYVVDAMFVEGMTDARLAFHNPKLGMRDMSEASSWETDSYKRGYKLQELLLRIEIIK